MSWEVFVIVVNLFFFARYLISLISDSLGSKANKLVRMGAKMASKYSGL